MKIFDETYELSKTAFIFLGRSGAGVRDLVRLKNLYPEATFFNRKDIGLIAGIRLVSRNYNLVYIHSSPWNVICRVLFPFKHHFLIVHNPPNFISRKSLFGSLDSIVLRTNLLIVDKFIFISRHVEAAYLRKKYNLLLSKQQFIEVNSTVVSEGNFYPEKPSIFFFGRYLPYKNLELFYELSKNFPKYDFYIYSHGCPNFIGDNIRVISSWINEAQVNSIYQRHQILITPYREVSQSGPFYLGLETGKILIAPDIAGFNDYRSNKNVVLYLPNTIENLIFALGEALKVYEVRREGYRE